MIRSFVMGGVVAFASLWPASAGGADTGAARNPCASWDSRWVPPPTIRVLVKAHGGYVVKRPFRQYVAEVMAAGAWPGTKPAASLAVGALAIKQYAWWEVLHRPCDRVWKGRAYDIENGGIHQLWRPRSGLRTPTRTQYAAVDETWAYHITKRGRFLRTGWTGTGGSCASYTDGFHAYEDGITDCARRGWTWQRIVRAYYQPHYALIRARRA